MRTILKLKHWQIFILSWGTFTIIPTTVFIAPAVIGLCFRLWLILFLISLMNSFIWVWAIVKELEKLSRSISTKLFKIAFWIPFIYIWKFICIMLCSAFGRKIKSINPEIEMTIFVCWGVLSVLCIIYGLAFIGRLIKSIELGRPLSIKEHIAESLLMLFPPIGIWIIQPKLNKIIAQHYLTATTPGTN